MTLDELVGETHIDVQCLVAEIEPEYCGGWSHSYDLDDPIYMDEHEKIHLPGIGLECGACGQMTDFEINGVQVHFP